jgi:hypothetical protein
MPRDLFEERRREAQRHEERRRALEYDAGLKKARRDDVRKQEELSAARKRTDAFWKSWTPSIANPRLAVSAASAKPAESAEVRPPASDRSTGEVVRAAAKWAFLVWGVVKVAKAVSDDQLEDEDKDADPEQKSPSVP